MGNGFSTSLFYSTVPVRFLNEQSVSFFLYLNMTFFGKKNDSLGRRIRKEMILIAFFVVVVDVDVFVFPIDWRRGSCNE